MLGRTPVRFATALACLGALAAPGAVAQVICLTDDEGKFACSDRFTPDQSVHDRAILNDQGVVIRTEQGAITPEERAAMDAAAREEEERQRIAEESARRDQVLLDSYLTVGDIERLRDRRLDLLNGQAAVAEIYLDNLRRKLERLLEDSKRFAPHSDRKDAPPIPEYLQIDIDRTKSSIDFREQQLAEIKANQREIRENFDRDIERFRLLKGV